MSEQEEKGFKNWIKNVFDFSRYDKQTKAFMIFFIGIIIVMVLLYAYQFLVDDTFLPRVVLYYVVIPLQHPNMLILGIFLFFGLMVLQAVVAPIPSEMILLASGLIWYFAGGIVIGFIGSMISAIIGFYIAKRGGRPLAVNTLGEKNVESLEYYMGIHGTVLVAGMRAIPMVPFDLFTIISGVTQMDFKRYMAATAIGTIPRVIFYAWAGATLFPGGVTQYTETLKTDPLAASRMFDVMAFNFNVFLLILVGVVILGFVVFYFVVLPRMRKGYEKTTES